MDDDVSDERMTRALLEVAEIELTGCDSMDPVIALARREGGKLTAYAHLRPLPGATGLFPFDALPARRAFQRDGVELFGIAYGVWRDRAGRLTAAPEGFPGLQAGVVAITGRRGAVAAVLHPIVWRDGRFAGFGEPQPLAECPVGDLLSMPADDVIVPLSAWKDSHR